MNGRTHSTNGGGTSSLRHFEKSRDKLLSDGASAIYPVSLRVIAASETSFRVAHNISYVKNGKRRSDRSCTETYRSPQEATERFLELKALRNLKSSGHAIPTTDLVTLLKDFYAYRVNQLLNDKPELKSLEDAIRNQRSTNDRGFSFYLYRFLREHDIATVEDLTSPTSAMSSYKRFLTGFTPKAFQEERLAYYRDLLLPANHLRVLNFQVKKADTKPLRVETVNKAIRYFHNFVKYLRFRGYNVRDFLEVKLISGKDRVKYGEVPGSTTSVIDRDTFIKIYNRIALHWRVPLLFVAITGCRRSEALGCLLPNVDLDKGTVFLHGFKEIEYQGKVFTVRNKSCKDRYVVLSSELVEALRYQIEFKAAVAPESPFLFFNTCDTPSKESKGWPRSGDNFQRDFHNTVRDLVREGAIPDRPFKIKDLRLSRSSNLIADFFKYGLEHAKHALGHADTRVTLNHYFQQGDDFRQSIRKILDEHPYGIDLGGLGKALELEAKGWRYRGKAERGE